MKKLQGSTAAWIVLLCAALGAGVFGVRAVLSFQSVASDSWQYSGRFSNARENRWRELVDGVYTVCRLDALEQQIAAGAADATLQADAEALRESREATEQRFARGNTWFRFRVLNADTGEVLGTNLAEGESMLKAVQDVNRQTFEVTEEALYEYGYYNSNDYGYEIGPSDQADQKADAEADPASV